MTDVRRRLIALKRKFLHMCLRIISHQIAGLPGGRVPANILDEYSVVEPARQASLDIFEGEWISHVPGFETGTLPLFTDPRVSWLGEHAGGFAGKRILELGPLECGHTFLMARAGATHITSIESNIRAFVKCLIVKEALGFSADIYLGDFRQYIQRTDQRFDFVLASGVLYHMEDPVELLEGLSRITDRFGVWTHYYEPSALAERPHLSRRFDPRPRVESFHGRTVVTHTQRYLEVLEDNTFCGGAARGSRWMTKDSLFGVLDSLGFDVDVGSDDPTHPAGPSLLFLASRKGLPSHFIS